MEHVGSKATIARDKSPRGPWLLEHKSFKHVSTRDAWSRSPQRSHFGFEEACNDVSPATRLSWARLSSELRRRLENFEILRCSAGEGLV